MLLAGEFWAHRIILIKEHTLLDLESMNTATDDQAVAMNVDV